MSSPELVCDGEKPAVQRPSTLTLADEDTHGDEDAMLRIWQDKLKRRDIVASSSSRDIDAALAEIARSGEDLQRLSTTTTTTETTTTTTSHRNSRLPISQPPPPVVAVTNTVLSPVMQESRPREPVTVLTERAVTSRERHRSMIDPSQVKEAVRLTSNPPSQVNQEQETLSRSFRSENSLHDRDDASKIMEDEKRTGDLRNVAENLEKDVRSADDPGDRSLMTRQNSMFRSRFIPDINVTSSPPSSGKVTRDQELNDEGFEETQSLVSETLSQETSSGNYETDTHDSTRCSPAELSYGGEQRRRSITITMDDDLHDRGNRRSLSVDKLSKPASGKVFGKKETARNASEKSSFLPTRAANVKRESTLRKTESLKKTSNIAVSSNNSRTPSKNEVQRSGSRSSLRSSRSSLNSATSVNTVRNVAANHAHLRSYTSAIRALTNDLRKSSPSSSPLPSKNVVDKRRPSPRQIGISRIPASRSSSSGSSIGPTARNLRKTPEVGTRVRISIVSRRVFEKICRP